MLIGYIFIPERHGKSYKSSRQNKYIVIAIVAHYIHLHSQIQNHLNGVLINIALVSNIKQVPTPHSSTIPDGTSRQDGTDSSTSEIPPGGSSTGQSISASPTSSTNVSSKASPTTGSSTSSTSTTTTTSTEPPIPHVPPPPPLTPRPPRRKGQDRITSEAAENTALIIGIIAGALIAIILIILIILKFKSRSDGSKSFQQSHAALLGQQMNGNLKNGSDKCGNKAAKKQGDVKEWYV
ncbi:hypothetical protein C0J52_25919 [Blattella germanica]|nr:hypothetical protein C0J52_25919 [Blattella germanica]